MLTVLPAGLASERYGRMRLMRLGIAGSCAAGLAIALLPSAPVVAIARVAEGVATGLFVSASLAFVNSRQDHGRLSGLYMASLNAGLLVGLIGTGVLVQVSGLRTAGVIVFTVLAVASLALVRGRDPADRTGAVNPAAAPGPRAPSVPLALLRYGRDLRRGWGGDRAISGVLLGRSRGLLGVQIALQNIATIVAILVVSRLPADPVRMIQGERAGDGGRGRCLLLLPVRFCRDRGRGGRGPDRQLAVPRPDGRAAGSA